MKKAETNLAPIVSRNACEHSADSAFCLLPSAFPL